MLCIFLVRIFVLCISPPAFFFLFKIKNRRKGSGKRADKRSRQKTPAKTGTIISVPSIFKNRISKFLIQHFGFSKSAHPNPPDQFFKIANHKNEFQKFCGPNFYPPIFFSPFSKIKIKKKDKRKICRRKREPFFCVHTF